MNFYKNYLKSIGEKPFRIKQIDQAFYKDFVISWDEITTLAKPLREKLNTIDFNQLEKVIEKTSPTDGTVKVLFKTKDGLKTEAVLMRHKDDRNTVCVSCQVGCAQGCTFCSTGKMGLTRDLTSDEILEQVLYFARKLNKEENQKITNIVYMGMGEPFHNYEEVLDSIKQIHDQKKLGLGARHITVSTSGVVPKIEEFMKEDLQLNLAISIHAGTDETRSKIMPVNMIYPLKDLVGVLAKYSKLTGRKIFYEYVMLKGVNDSKEEAEALGRLIEGQVAHVNIIPYNPGVDNDLECSDKSTMYAFQNIFKKYGIPSTIRVSLGQDIDGACGQLAAKEG